MKNRRASDILCVALCAVIIFSFAAAIFAKPQQSFSERENRTLSTFPTPNTESLLNGRFFADVTDFYTDQFPLRPFFTALKANCERVLLRHENNGIIFGKNGTLIPRGEIDTKTLEKNLSALRVLQKNTGACICIVPRAVDVLESKLPSICDTSVEKGAWKYVDSALAERIDITNTLKSDVERGEYVWYKTDHHWTTDGAFVAYAAIAGALGVPPYPLSEFERITVSEEFLGTSFSKSGLYSSACDSVTLYRYDSDTELSVYNYETKDTEKGLYSFDKLTQKDKYLVLLGGNYSRITITDNTTERPKLLLIKDSFANALIPFLARHFDLDVIDPRYFVGDISELVRSERYDKTLILIGLGTLETTPLRS